MMNANEKKLARTNLLLQAQRIAETATQEGREITPDERQNMESAAAAAAAIREDLDRPLPRKGPSFGGFGYTADGFPRSPGTVQPSSEWRDGKGGSPVFVLSPSQRWIDLPTQRTDIKASDLSLGRAIRAMIIGDWRGAESEQRAIL